MVEHGGHALMTAGGRETYERGWLITTAFNRKAGSRGCGRGVCPGRCSRSCL